jgi:acetylornithine deacetylase/succinyl-diaminopimelate desuccinylase-like protein
MRLTVCFIVGVLLAVPTTAQVERLGNLPDRAVDWVQEYIQIDTINPPGNEIDGARFLAGIFEAEGIPYEMAESAAGRGNIWARLSGGNEPALVLLHHIDVVPADPNYWSTDPLSGEVREGFLYGRGTLDTKTLGIVQLAAFLNLHRSGVALDRDVIYLATADEEAGGYFGVGWLVEERPELFDGVGYVLNEGGGGGEVDDHVQVSVEVTQKVPYWIRITSRGQPGHGSRPQASTAVTRLVSALDRLRQHEFDARVIPPVDRYFRALAPSVPREWQERYADMGTALETQGFGEELRDFNSSHFALTRNTCSMTRLSGSNKINVIPTEAWAELDCRLLPDQDGEAFLRELDTVLGDAINVETLMRFTPAQSSAETGLFRVIEDVTREHFPEASIVPSVSTGFTDSHFLRDLNITAYGYSPFVIPRGDSAGVHGNDERISVLNIRRGVQVMSDVVERWVVD